MEDIYLTYQQWDTPTPPSPPDNYTPPINTDLIDEQEIMVDVAETGVSYYQFFNENGAMDFMITILMLLLVTVTFRSMQLMLRRIR